MKLTFTGDITPYHNGLQILSQMGYFIYSSGEDSHNIIVSSIKRGLSVTKKNNKITLNCSSRTLFFRGLGLILGNLEKETDFEILETPKFKKCGVQLDASGNSVPTVETIRKFAAIMSLMGLNVLQLHIPDMITLPDHPYLGYLRGRYSQEELKEINRYGEDFGVEIVPSIEILCGMDTVTRWGAYIAKIWEYKNVLLCDSEDTYAFLEDIIKELSDCFSSDIINLGTDSAQMLGLWKHLHVFGFEEREEILKKHLQRVGGICKKHGYKTILWGDRFYRENCFSLEEAVKKFLITLSAEIIPVCEEWESTSTAHYENLINCYQKEKNAFVFAGGMRNFSGVTPDISMSLDMAKASLPVCLAKNIEMVLLSTKSEDGAECSHFVTLPVLQMYGEIANTGVVPSNQQLSSRLLTCAKMHLDDMLLLDSPNYVTGAKKAGDNPSKYLLYQDVCSGLFDRHTTEQFPTFYRNHIIKINKAAHNNKEWQYLFCTSRDLCSVLEIKSRLTNDLRKAYRDKDRSLLSDFLQKVIPDLEIRINNLLESHKVQWDKENKIQGFETVNIRLGGISARLKTVQYRLNQYLNGQITDLKEFEDELLFYDNKKNAETDVIYENAWHLISTTNYSAF